MSLNVNIDHTFIRNSQHTLLVAPHKDCEILRTYVNDKFTYNGSSRYVHNKTGIIYYLPAGCFLNSNTYYWDASDRLTVKSLLLNTELQAKDTVTGKVNNLTAGTIFNQWREKGSKYIVTTNKGTEVYISKTDVSKVININNTAQYNRPYIRQEVKESVKPEPNPRLQAALSVPTPKENKLNLPKGINIVQTFKVDGIDMVFNTIEEAILAQKVMTSLTVK